MTEDLRERLARLDPMHAGVSTPTATDESSRHLLENIMSTPLKEETETAPAPRRTWTIAVAAVAALVLAVAGGIAFTGGRDTPPVASGDVLELTAANDDPLASCIVFSPEELDRVAETAFAGTVTAIDGDRVTLNVDSWYRGEEVAQVALIAPPGMEALIGGIPFETGGQYLISAQNGTINYCGFSGPLTPEYRVGFETAFAQG